ncbi:hypothetical protein [Enterovirga sp. CN4-39]|uniref:hypothetical protein n=1 Tax=Enterovirga sp. CN4-39 TaxID=3400910 RepID=UPI003C0F5D49
MLVLEGNCSAYGLPRLVAHAGSAPVCTSCAPVALQTSNIALQKASNAKVQEFAQFEHDEQTTIAESLKSMDPSRASAKPDEQGMATAASRALLPYARGPRYELPPTV